MVNIPTIRILDRGLMLLPRLLRRSERSLFAAGFHANPMNKATSIKAHKYGDVSGKKYYEDRVRGGQWMTEGTPQTLTEVDMSNLVHLIGVKNILDPLTGSDVSNYSSDWLRQFHGEPRLVLKPGSTDEVASVVEYCWRRSLPIIPFGGNTSLCGGTVPLEKSLRTHHGDEITLSMERLNRVFSIDQDSGIVHCEAGTVLQALDEAVAPYDLAVPLDLGSKGSCQIGGNLATNAAGLRYLRFGSLRGSCVGMKVVLPDGRLLDMLSACTLPKDNVGYDLKQLFIGSEGTLGIITEAALMCPPRFHSRQVALLRVPRAAGWDGVLALRRLARRRLGEIQSAFELVDGSSVAVVGYVYGANLPWPLTATAEAAAPAVGRRTRSSSRTAVRGVALPGGYEGVLDSDKFIVIETLGSNAQHDKEKMESFLQEALSSAAADDGVVAESEAQAAQLWSVRELVPSALARAGGHIFKYDFSLPLPVFYELIDVVRAKVARMPGVLAVTGHGHVGDMNVHLNVVCSAHGLPVNKHIEAELEPFVYQWVSDRGGSVSAEHGVGQLKKPYVEMQKSPTHVEIMESLKRFFDFSGLMNRDKVVSADSYLDKPTVIDVAEKADVFNEMHRYGTANQLSGTDLDTSTSGANAAFSTTSYNKGLA